jgi:glycosyltransferase involved in cell wall biosynthesis
MLAQSYAPVIGGEERVVEDLSRELVARGHSVAVATLSRDSSSGSDGVRVHVLRSSIYRLPRRFHDAERRHAIPAPDPETVFDLRRVIRKESPDVVHAHNWIAHSYTPLRRSAGVPMVLSLHDYALICATKRLFYKNVVCSGPGIAKCVECAGQRYGRTAGGALAVGMKLTVPHTRRAVDMFVPISEAVREGCGLQGGDPYRVIPNFVRQLPDRPANDDPRLNALPRVPFILFFGDATVDKGARHLANVYRRLDSPPPLVFAGRCFVDELRTIPGVILNGPLPHHLAIEAVRRSLFTVVPSLWAEPFGLVALETAAAGKPIVASDIGGLRDIVVHGETGLLVQATDEHDLRSALHRLISDQQLREALGRSAADRAATFDPAKVVPQFEDVYRTVTSNEHVP